MIHHTIYLRSTALFFFYKPAIPISFAQKIIKNKKLKFIFIFQFKFHFF